ncbi:hypothetical protein EMN47_03040 [Prolixibacteraceae bacterium JC049]|nr:hypothetical protein [Prolixibacteraceae bacterium JC049]
MKLKFISQIILFWAMSMAAQTVVTAQTLEDYADAISDPLPDGWFHRDIGELKMRSNVVYNDEEGSYFVQAAGKNVWGKSDECHFVYFPTEEDKQIVVRLLDFSGQSRAKAFVMIRSSLDADAAMCFFELKHKESACFLSYRKQDGGNCNVQSYVKHLDILYPRYMKFIRQGKYIQGLISLDAKQWTPIGSPLKLPLRGRCYMGIAACGGVSDGTGYVKALFDNLEVSDIELPYKVQNPMGDKSMNIGQEKEYDLTNVFGHYMGDYWRVEAESTDEEIATVESYEKKNSAFEVDGGEQFFKKIKVRGKNPGIATIKLTTNLAGYKLTNTFLVEVKGEGKLIEIDPQWPTEPWTIDDIGTEDTLSMVEYGDTMRDRVRMVTSQKQSTGTVNGSAFLYQQFEKNDQLELTAFIDTVTNTGDGSFAGLMMRGSMEGNAPFVAMQAGSFEGVKFSYRWESDREVNEIVDNEIDLPCWVKMRKYRDEFGDAFFDVFHSYDGIYWKKYLRYPFPLELEGLNVYAGLTGTGGTKVNETRKCEQVFKNIDVRVNEEFSSLNYVTNIEDLREPMTMSKNPVSTSTDITFKVVKPGQVILAVYDSYGVMQEQILNEHKGVGEYTITYTPKSLKKEGIYLLRLATSENHDFLKFIYKPE